MVDNAKLPPKSMPQHPLCTQRRRAGLPHATPHVKDCHAQVLKWMQTAPTSSRKASVNSIQERTRPPIVTLRRESDLRPPLHPPNHDLRGREKKTRLPGNNGLYSVQWSTEQQSDTTPVMIGLAQHPVVISLSTKKIPSRVFNSENSF